MTSPYPRDDVLYVDWPSNFPTNGTFGTARERENESGVEILAYGPLVCCVVLRSIMHGRSYDGLMELEHNLLLQNTLQVTQQLSRFEAVKIITNSFVVSY